ncbi:MAG: polysaccharide biosynthesis tyrosine autokinase, partial [Gemmatimonadales bacterium]
RVLASASRELREIPPRAIEEARLDRAVTIAENLYTTLEQRYSAAQLAEASSVPDVRILDAAVVPLRPLQNRAARIVMLAFLASLGCAVVGAVLLDRADPHVWYPEHVSRGMGLTILGALPHIARNSDSILSPAEMGPVVEALRGIRMNLLNVQPSPLALTVTSPGKGDGKSFVSSNLALTFAVGGHRTVLIDGDLRRGLLHRRLGGHRQPGLADYLHGDTAADLLSQPTRYPNLTLIGCGTRTHRAPELLGSTAMARLLDHLRASFDVILIDSPPLAAGVDPYLLATHTGRLALVLRARVSDRDLARAKLDVLDRLPVRLLGAILNDVPGGMIYRYYYTPYNYYLPGYEAPDEAEAWPGVVR